MNAACGSCGKPDARSKCSRCQEVHYCSVECQRKAWPTHRAVCVAPDLRAMAKAIEIALLGRSSPVIDATLRRLIETLDITGEMDRSAKGLVTAVLDIAYLPPVVAVSPVQFVAFFPMMCAGVYESHAAALASLVPLCEAAQAERPLPKLLPNQLSAGLNHGSSPPWFSEWAMLAPVWCRFSEEMRPGAVGLQPEDFKRLRKNRREAIDPNLQLVDLKPVPRIVRFGD